MKLSFFANLTSIAKGAGTACLLLAANAHAGNTARLPELPSPLCDSIQAGGEEKVISHLYAIGVQIYRWTGSTWQFQGPEAGLYADAGYHGLVGIHYAGPHWELNDGSTVKGSLAGRCTPFQDGIDWLLLNATPLTETGLFSRVTSIQRVNTVGGLPPTYSGSIPGEEARVPYTAEYYFYRLKAK